MIIPNGYVEFKHKSLGGIDITTGYPLKATSVHWSKPIPCQFRANRHNSLGRVNGESFTLANYEILIEEQDLTTEQLRLTNYQGHIIGEFSIISSELLNTVCQIRILV